MLTTPMVRCENVVCFGKYKAMCGEFNEFLIIKQIKKLDCALFLFCCKIIRKRLEHSRSRRYIRLCLVFPPTLLLHSSRFLRAL